MDAMTRSGLTSPGFVYETVGGHEVRVETSTEIIAKKSGTEVITLPDVIFSTSR